MFALWESFSPNDWRNVTATCCLALAMLLDSQPEIVAADYILLHNGNVIEGESYSIGPYIVVDRGDGNELKLDVRQVGFRASSIAELYQFRKSKRLSSSVSSYHDDARWCFRNGLLLEMAEAIEMAEDLDPTHPETVRLRRQLTAHHKLTYDRAQRASDPTYNVPTDFVVSTFEQTHVTGTNVDELADLALPHQALAHFSNRIQPLLVNRCGNNGCHRGPSQSSWELTHMGTHIRPSSRMTKLNLIATIKAVRAGEGEGNDFLRYASHAHGGKLESPLKPTDQLSLESLTQWVNDIMTTEPSVPDVKLTELRETSGRPIPVSSRVELVNGASAAVSPVRQVGYVDEPADSAVPPTGNGIKRAAVDSLAPGPRDTGRPVRLPAVENPFDPAIFNRHYRSMRPDSTGTK